MTDPAAVSALASVFLGGSLDIDDKDEWWTTPRALAESILAHPFTRRERAAIAAAVLTPEVLAEAVWEANKAETWGDAVDTTDAMADAILAALGRAYAIEAGHLLQSDGSAYPNDVDLMRRVFEAANVRVAAPRSEDAATCGDDSWDTRYECVKPQGHPDPDLAALLAEALDANALRVESNRGGYPRHEAIPSPVRVAGDAPQHAAGCCGDPEPHRVAGKTKLREALATKGTIYESVLLHALGAIVDADHPGSEDGTGKWRCRCEAHSDAHDLLAAAFAAPTDTPPPLPPANPSLMGDTEAGR